MKATRNSVPVSRGSWPRTWPAPVALFVIFALGVALIVFAGDGNSVLSHAGEACVAISPLVILYKFLNIFRRNSL